VDKSGWQRVSYINKQEGVFVCVYYINKWYAVMTAGAKLWQQRTHTSPIGKPEKNNPTCEL